MKREYDYTDDLAQRRLKEATAAAVKAAEVSKRRAMEAQRSTEAQQAATSQANVSRPLGLAETIMPTANKVALACIEVEPKGEEEDTHLVRRAIEARKSVYGYFSEGLAA